VEIFSSLLALGILALAGMTLLWLFLLLVAEAAGALRDRWSRGE
jgi:hypothetical protein